MRRLSAAVAALCVLTSGAPANAEGVNNLMAGINGVATFMLDPMKSAAELPEEFEDLWGARVTAHAAGLAQGTVLMVYRATMGVLDIALFPFWVFPTLSPEAKFDLFPSYEIEYD